MERSEILKLFEKNPSQRALERLKIFAAGTDAGNLPATDANILFNVAGIKQNGAEIRKQLQEAGHTGLVMLDSGGFELWNQRYKKGATILTDKNLPISYEGCFNLTPYHVIDCAMKLEPDIMIGLDFPAYVKKEPSPHLKKGVLEFEFLNKLGFNFIWTRQIPWGSALDF